MILGLYMGVQKNSPCIVYWNQKETGTTQLNVEKTSLPKFQLVKCVWAACDPKWEWKYFLPTKSQTNSCLFLKASKKECSWFCADKMMVMNYKRSSDSIKMQKWTTELVFQYMIDSKFQLHLYFFHTLKITYITQCNSTNVNFLMYWLLHLVSGEIETLDQTGWQDLSWCLFMWIGYFVLWSC